MNLTLEQLESIIRYAKRRPGITGDTRVVFWVHPEGELKLKYHSITFGPEENDPVDDKDEMVFELEVS
jgi:hypothetical protein